MNLPVICKTHPPFLIDNAHMDGQYGDEALQEGPERFEGCMCVLKTIIMGIFMGIFILFYLSNEDQPDNGFIIIIYLFIYSFIYLFIYFSAER